MLFLLLHAVYASIFAFILAHLFGTLNVTIAIFSLSGSCGLAFYHARIALQQHPDWRWTAFSSGAAGAIEITLALFILYAAFRHFAWLIFPMDHAWYTLHANNFGDLPMHINYIRALANGLSFPPPNPIFAQNILCYPYGVDLYNALWEILGVNLQGHLFIVGWLATLILLILLRSLASWWGIGALFLNGGFISWQLFTSSGLRDYQASIDWKNLFLAVITTQRGMLFALPMGLILIIAYRRLSENEINLAKNNNFSNEPATSALSCHKPDRHNFEMMLGILWGFLPLFNAHVFVVVSMMLAAIGFETHGMAGVKRLLCSRITHYAYIPAIIFLIHYTVSCVKIGNIIRLRFGWTTKATDFFSFLAYLFENFGLWLFMPILIAALLFFFSAHIDRLILKKLKFELIFYVGLFSCFFNVMFAPWEWDNIKLLIWPYLGLARLSWLVLEPKMVNLTGQILRLTFAVALFINGLIAILWTLQPPLGYSPQLYKMSELAAAEGALIKVPTTAIFAAAQTHQHVLTYFGRLRIAGYSGHLWSHGIDYKITENKLNTIMNGGDDWLKLVRELGITHIFWGPDERSNFPTSRRPWTAKFKNSSPVIDFEIYDLSQFIDS